MGPRWQIVGPSGAVHLEPGAEVRIGRRAGNDLLVDHPTVSRFHARVRWPDGADGPVVEDLGSANGTRLQGRPVVGAARLTGESATLVVGDVEVALRLDDPSLLAEPHDTACRLFTDRDRPDESGQLAGATSLRALLLGLERAGRTGTVALELGPAKLRLTFAAGRIVHAAADGLLEPMLAGLLPRFDMARYAVQADVEPVEGTAGVSPRALLQPEPSAPAHLEVASPAVDPDAWTARSRRPRRDEDTPFFGVPGRRGEAHRPG